MFVQAHAPESVILDVGGVWDRHEQRWATDTEGKRLQPQSCRLVRVQESQAETVEYFARWLEAFRAGTPRDRLLMLGGDRRGGKTFILVALILCLAIEFPGATTYIVSPTIERRDEIDDTIHRKPNKLSLPVALTSSASDVKATAWARYTGEPRFEYALANGSTVRNLSGAVPGVLKRGGALALLLNEPQEMPARTAAFAVPAVIDTGGLTMLATNPPLEGGRGVWVHKLKTRLLAPVAAPGQTARRPRGKYIEIRAESNATIDQATREDVPALIEVIDPEVARADGRGDWRDPIERAYWAWQPGLVIELPESLVDVTPQFTRQRLGRGYPLLGGVDFQGRPHLPGVIARLFAGELEIDFRAGGKRIVEATPQEPFVVAVDEVITQPGYEDEFLDDLEDAKYTPEELYWIGDATGATQGARRHEGVPPSFDAFNRRQWLIEGPRKKRSNRGKAGSNPSVARRLAVVNGLLGDGRLLVAGERVGGELLPMCPHLVNALAECRLGPSRYAAGRIPVGKEAHATDAAGYLAYWVANPERDPGLARRGRAWSVAPR